jgi:4'-phosphopantetheinyl transferase
LWLVDGHNVSDEDLAFFLQQLGPGEIARHARFIRPERARQFVLGRVLLRLAMGKLLNLSPTVINVVERNANAPDMVLPEPHPTQPGFSLSHSGRWIACVVGCDIKLGLDIEIIDPHRDLLEISRSAFHADEHAWLQQQPDVVRVATFYHLWSFREALWKLLSNLGTQTAFPLLVGQGGALREGEDPEWHRTTLLRTGLSCVVCSTRPLAKLLVIEAVQLTCATWRQALDRSAK